MVVGSHLRALELWHYDKMGIPGEVLRPDNENLNTDWTAGHL